MPAQPYVGQIMCTGFNFNPVGWLPCDGSLLDISQYSTLFNLIGTTYGGDGQSTFAVPDLRGRAPMHIGSNGGNAHTIGEVGGTEKVQLNTNQIPSHTHGVNEVNANGNTK